MHVALLDEAAGRGRGDQPRLPRRALPLARPSAPARAAARADHPRPVRSRADRAATDRARGSTTAAGACGIRSAATEAAPADARPTSSSRPKARACTRSRSARSMPASSSPGISASPPTARPWSAWRQRLGYVHKGIEGLMAGADLERAAQARRPHLGRQHGRLCAWPSPARPRPRSASRRRRARSLAARAHGRARAPRQPSRRHRRDLQRCRLRAHARPLRRPARARAARRRRLLRPPADARPDRAGRRRGRPRRGRRRGHPRPARRGAAALPGAGRALRQHRLAAGPHRRHRRARSRRSPASYGAGGYVGRASGRAFDARRAPGYPPYDSCASRCRCSTAGDVDARVWIRIREVEQSLSLVEQILERLPAGPVARGRAAAGPGEGIALVEGFRGDVLVWLRLGADGTVARCHLRDPSWFQWPLLEAAIEGNIVADFPLCNKSFNCSYSGHDL